MPHKAGTNLYHPQKELSEELLKQRKQITLLKFVSKFIYYLPFHAPTHQLIPSVMANIMTKM